MDPEIRHISDPSLFVDASNMFNLASTTVISNCKSSVLPAIGATTILTAGEDWARMQGQEAQPPHFFEVLDVFDGVRLHCNGRDAYQL
jgi:hypothetical protein